ncbi:hypothetical protein DAPPUDRAFT_307752 [Daphnia pulex]|uniref:Uncharacterized protein n=1 Tax=Daphnia pulex TaxID=6669 RepID=E9G1M3_DAPPU|nr:hypothetical protein DAPPUDRAFT_307752 [Daphnia pulex]|eukprot:EFX86520.1 hypothetical protein DAPPUDRAFT_307752 [Daphnia pulex]
MSIPSIHQKMSFAVRFASVMRFPARWNHFHLPVVGTRAFFLFRLSGLDRINCDGPKMKTKKLQFCHAHNKLNLIRFEARQDVRRTTFSKRIQARRNFKLVPCVRKRESKRKC